MGKAHEMGKRYLGQMEQKIKWMVGGGTSAGDGKTLILAHGGP